MKGIAIFSLMVILRAGDASPQQNTGVSSTGSSRGARLGPVPFPVVRENNEKPTNAYSDNSFELECEDDHGVCEGHCNALGHISGECIGDVCYCHSDHRTTFECDRIVPVGKIVMSEKHKSCKIHCQLLRKEFVGGECIGGKCHCKEKSHDKK